jgi:hypothetical protein
LALLMLYLSGAGLLWFGLNDNPNYLSNQKLQAKLILVVILSVNALVLHRITFPRLAYHKWVSRWTLKYFAVVAVSVALSNSLWFFCAFLGIARPWNFTTPLSDVLTVGLYFFGGTLIVISLTLWFASIDRRYSQPGRWVPKIKKMLHTCACILRI